MQAWPQPTVPHLSELGLGTNTHPLSLTGVDGSAHQVALEPTMSLYVCGITPYDATHMGHASTYLAFDVLGRLWRDAGSDVTYVQNVTDVDDPLLERAESTGEDWQELAQRETQLFREDMQALNVIAPQHYVGVVESVQEIARAVRALLENGSAYQLADGTGDIYFDSSASNDAWHLGSESGLDEATMLELFAARGGDPERAGKRHALDPLLWRGAREGEPSWNAEGLPAGRPGWHIECAVIATTYLPTPFSVQGGGSDLIFPHHEFSSAHASLQSGELFARHFAHAGMVGYEGEKMSKSLGNLVLVSALRSAGTDPRAIRLAVHRHHYREDWSWDQAALDAATADLATWSALLPSVSEEQARATIESMRAHLANDLDTPRALAALDALFEEVSALKHDDGGPADTQRQGATLLNAALDALLGIRLV